MYKGYVETKGKVPIESFKNKKHFKKLDEVKDLDSYAGVLGDNTIMIDVDEMDASNILYKIIKDKEVKCRVVETSRGKHFIFRNDGKVSGNKTNVTLAIGIKSDIKIGKKASVECLKCDGVIREILQDCDTPDQIPIWLMPTKSKKNMLDLAEGEGRNDELFGFILCLQSIGLIQTEIQIVLPMINDYVLKDKLSKSELNVIMRDEAFEHPTFIDDSGKFLHNVFADYIVKTEHVIKINGALNVYDDGVYVADQNLIYKAMLKHIPTLKKQVRAEIMSYLNITIADSNIKENKNLIAFKNGIYDVKNEELIEFNPDIIITNKIPHNYNPSASCELAKKTLANLSDGDMSIRKLLEESIGFAMYRSNNIAGGKAFLLTGDKANGKSTFLECYIGNVIGESNTTNLDLWELGERFSTASLYNKLANIGDDISDEFLQGSQIATFKKIVTGDKIKAEFKHQDVFNFKPFCKLFFSANSIPRMRDRTGAVLRRLIIIPFNHTFTKKDAGFNPFIRDELNNEESIEFIINIGLKGLKRIITNNDFTESKKAQKELDEYAEENNPILQFINEYKVENESTDDVYRSYVGFCYANNLSKPFSKNVFVRDICKRLNLKSKQLRIDGKHVKVFKEEEGN